MLSYADSDLQQAPFLHGKRPTRQKLQLFCQSYHLTPPYSSSGIGAVVSKADALHEETAAGIDCVLQPLQGVNTHRVIHKSYRWIIPFLFLTVSYPYP